MKKSFTLIIVSFICLKLSALTYAPADLKLSVLLPISDTANLSARSNHKDSLKLIRLITDLLITDDTKFSAPAIPKDSTSTPLNISDNFRSLTSSLQLDSLRSTILSAQIHRDSLERQMKRDKQVILTRLLKISDPDSLKNELKQSANDTLKAMIFTRLAELYLNFDTISNKKKQLTYQNEALSYTLLAIHQYSRYDDTTGLRLSFDNLAKVYYKQKKYSQAKWFILQSNSLSRAKNDVPNIISSLLTLSSVKIDIKDYALAMRDLDEAMQLSKANHSQAAQLKVLQTYIVLYHRQKKYPQEVAMLKKRDSLQESIRKTEEAKLIAKLAAQNALQRKKLDSLQNKKKVYTSGIRKLYKNGSAKKIASL